jgi:hypothetical protein
LRVRLTMFVQAARMLRACRNRAHNRCHAEFALQARAQAAGGVGLSHDADCNWTVTLYLDLLATCCHKKVWRKTLATPWWYPAQICQSRVCASVKQGFDASFVVMLASDQRCRSAAAPRLWPTVHYAATQCAGFKRVVKWFQTCNCVTA